MLAPRGEVNLALPNFAQSCHCLSYRTALIVRTERDLPVFLRSINKVVTSAKDSPVISRSVIPTHNIVPPDMVSLLYTNPRVKLLS
jgi:hypothetical protein